MVYFLNDRYRCFWSWDGKAKVSENGGVMFMILNTLSAIAVIEMENQVIKVSSRSEKWSRSFAEQDTILREFLYVTADQSKQTAVVEIKDVQESLGSVFVHKGIIRRVLEGRGRNRSCSGCKIEAAG